MYETVLKNKEYLDLAEKIGKIKFITNDKWDWEHGLGHYKRVATYVKKILKQLKEDERTIDLGMTAALLHDIGLSESNSNKTDHALKSSMMFQKFLMNTDINNSEKEILEQAIKDHSKGNELKSNIGLALVLADKLDITYHRTINSSIQDTVNKEYQKIKKVDVEINNKDLIVKYTVEKELNFDIIKEWEKPITIPKKVARYLNKNCIFKFNNEIVEP